MNDDYEQGLLEGMRRAQESMKTKPHPDTARADAAERMLAGVMAMLRDRDGLHSMKYSGLFEENPGLQSWWLAKQRRVYCLIAERDRCRAALAEAERELASLTASAAPAGG